VPRGTDGDGGAAWDQGFDPALTQARCKCMAVKTITIDLEAYDALARHKKPGQSFSKVIKLHFGPRKSVGTFRQALRAASLSDHTLAGVEGLVRSRKKSAARVPTL